MGYFRGATFFAAKNKNNLPGTVQSFRFFFFGGVPGYGILGIFISIHNSSQLFTTLHKKVRVKSCEEL